MKFVNSITALACIASIAGHSNLHSPHPRGNLKWWGYCSRGQGCETACDAPKAASTIDQPWTQAKEIRRGETMQVDWLRQNHPGGFVRLAMVPFDQSDDPAAFDSHAFHYSCYETDCREDIDEPILGKNNGNGSQLCTTKFTVPKSLPNGKVTLQWIWYGGGVLFADQNASFAHYVNCADMKVVGDEPVENVAIQPTFDSRDRGAGLTGQCRFWSTNSIHGCPKGAEDNELNKVEKCGYGGERFGAPAELNQLAQAFGDQPSNPLSIPTSQPPVSPPAPATSAAPSPAPTSAPTSAPVDQGEVSKSASQPPKEVTPAPTPAVSPDSKPSPSAQPDPYKDNGNQKPHPKKCHKKVHKN